ncbi:hypothetical protein, partial [Hymenobacter crusticola]|uniref:hypothetical protein n=1 Tax=Hymenobacter crusticola TaxID=1770526 RepID=UPI001C4E5133
LLEQGKQSLVTGGQIRFVYQTKAVVVLILEELGDRSANGGRRVVKLWRKVGGLMIQRFYNMLANQHGRIDL